MKRLMLSLILIVTCPSFAKYKPLAKTKSEPLKIALFDKPPFAWKENGKMRGFHYAVAQGVADRVQRPLEIALVPVRRAMEMLRSGEVDIVIMTDQTSFEEMKTHKAFIIDIGTYIFTRKKGPQFTSVKDLKGSLGRLAGGCSELGELPEVKWTDMKSYEQGLDVLLLERVDAVCGTDSFLYVTKSVKGSTEMIKSLSLQKKAVYIHALPSMNLKKWKAVEEATNSLVQDGSIQKWALENQKF
jgi:ABC-type amino acid transport substrate-binding protein